MFCRDARFIARTLTECEDTCSGLSFAIIDRAFEGAETPLGHKPKQIIVADILGGRI
jgi:hypothetical protein